MLADAYAKKVTAAGFSIDEAIEALKPYKPAKKASAAKGVKLPAKYRGPNGEEWSGKGQDPKWLKAFIAAGKKKEDYLIK